MHSGTALGNTAGWEPAEKWGWGLKLTAADPEGRLPARLSTSQERIQAAIGAVKGGTDAQRAQVHQATALSAIRELSALQPHVAQLSLEEVADVLNAFLRRIGKQDT